MDIDENAPPILPDVRDELHKYLVCPELLPIHQFERNQEFWPRKPNVPSLLHYNNSTLVTTLKVQRDPNTGQITGFSEVPVKNAGDTARNSLSMTRAPIAPIEATRGSSAYLPFWPAGFPEDPVLDLTVTGNDEELLTTPPGFAAGLFFEPDNVTVSENDTSGAQKKGALENNVINLMDVVKEEQKVFDSWTVEDAVVGDDNVILLSKLDKEESRSLEEEEIIYRELPVLKISEKRGASQEKRLKSTEWAILLDTSKPVANFDELVPDKAHKYSFELDTFQKLAIIHLEKHNHVFVAAHTSAGKTVVAEYAIALSQKHLTRCVYTSPIKALSNQKYRDFKRTFKDVGLITGDFQINPTASCLIMTTEILRSMLFCGSELTRDLEYVIFDEVHYINDEDRGHVWEQTLILLPPHVCVVLLSATVPNAIEFADWLGRNYQKKVYVIPTSKRPVPLKHYLYTGTGGKSKDNRYLLMDDRGWRQEGFSKACGTIKEADSGARRYGSNVKADKTLWSALIDHLKRNNLLPVVAFTFSRAKCDQNAYELTNIDLTTETEKHKIYAFFEECVKTLKEPDRVIPQVVKLKDILLRGIGVHHSGILPILKEIVEMLFQHGLIKLLFATETFAMGVNMPARTVIFDSMYKHDGKKHRPLLPAEYIQMAGRAGRRGLDEEGVVIILTKSQKPDESAMKSMMTCEPSKLQSQFRLTYGMVLSLLRKESFSVEEVMSRSFKEASYQKNKVSVQTKIKSVKEKLQNRFASKIDDHLQPLVDFYTVAKDYLDSRKAVMTQVLTNKKYAKEMSPGRVLIITHKHHMNKMAILLSVTARTQVTFKVLVLTDEADQSHEPNAQEPDEKTDCWYKMLGLASEGLYTPVGAISHEILTIESDDIMKICNKSVKIDPELVKNDWDKRQIPRFKDTPPGQACTFAQQELQQLTNPTFIELRTDDPNIYTSLTYLSVLETALSCFKTNLSRTPNFLQHFRAVFDRKSLEDELSTLEYSGSHKSLSLIPDYENRIKVLQKLKYVDEQRRIELKGKVACEIGMNELMITELVLENILKNLAPAEVAALLSSLVFQNKMTEESYDKPEAKALENGIKQIQEVARKIENLEHSYGVETLTEPLNFGLVNVVYKWASNTPFVEIMQDTPMQEGIIVRCIQQLNEIICDVRNAARIIGDPELQSKMEEASAAIKRDIVFAASLYTKREADRI